MRKHNGRRLSSGAQLSEGQVTTTEILDETLTLADLDPSEGTPGQVPTINAEGDAVEWATPSSGGPSLSTANTFTAPQTFAIIDGHGATVEEAGRFRHEASATSNGCGVAVALSKKTTGVGEVDLGNIIAVTRDDDAWIDVRPLRRVGASPTVGLRCRTTEADAVNGVEVLPKAAAPIIQPCQSAVGNPNVSLIVKPSGVGTVDLQRPTIPSGTVAAITGGSGIWASPAENMVAIATDANSGAGALAVYRGGSWKMSALVALA